MINRKQLLIIFLCVAGFTAVYLYYVKKERQASIALYFPHPQTGDIYKMQTDTRAAGVQVFYLKIKDIGAQSIYFYRGKMNAGAMYDVLLSHFDLNETRVFTKDELSEIVAGKWKVPGRDMTQLLEIERR